LLKWRIGTPRICYPDFVLICLTECIEVSSYVQVDIHKREGAAYSLWFLV